MNIDTETMMAVNPLTWAYEKGIYLRDGIQFTLQGMGYLFGIIDCEKRISNCKKGSQMCLTTAIFLNAVHACKYRRYDQNILYMMPTKTAVERLSQVSFDPIFQFNPWIMKKGDTNTTMCREINGRSIVMVGAQPKKVGGSATKDSDNLRSIPCDEIDRDELDLMDLDMAYQAKQRLKRSKFKIERNFGTPTFPNYGIDLKYEQCIVPETKILTIDLRWKLAGDLKLGDKIIGFDEQRLSDNKTRRYRETEVTNCSKAELPCIKVYLDDGNTISISVQHKFLIDRDGQNILWKKAQKLKIGDKLLSIGMWEEEKTQESGWISGVYDGEGCIRRSIPDRKQRRGRATAIRFAQNPGAVLSQVETFLTKRDFRFSNYNVGGCVSLHLKGGLPEQLRFLGTFRPVRLMQKSSVIWNDVSVGNDQGNTKKPRVLKIEYIGFKTVITLGTKHKTFIANGLLSHNSDQRKWQIRCSSCGHYTCLGETFPDCIIQKQSRWFRSCVHCQAEIYVQDGGWQLTYPDRREAGFWVSGLLSPLADLDDYMYEYHNTEGKKRSEFMRSTLGIATTEAESQLDETVVLSRCTSDHNKMVSVGETVMGMDIGKKIHLVIGTRTSRESYDISHVGIHDNLYEVHDIALKMNVHGAVIDSGPYDHGVREFQKTEPYTIYLCQYSEQSPCKPKFDGKTGIVKVNRNEWCDKVHATYIGNGIRIPRPSVLVNEYARQMTRTAQTVITHPDTGLKKPRWIKLGDDHFYHSTLYFLLAASRQSPRAKGTTKVNRPTHTISHWK